ncbi:hypothetical protein KDA14_04405, partial [Candidatus Saccharibacteria bacterium]|nr:hypothetical protein [Candidatus Saccharibacteria bacterium]
MSKEVKLEDIVSLCKRRGFIFQGSDIYGGLAGTWDYGPLGLALKKNIMDLWWQTFVDSRDDMYGVDAAILMNQKVWQASGHTATFTDPITVCGVCNGRQRVDKIVNVKSYTQYIEVALEKLIKEEEKRWQGRLGKAKEFANQKSELGELVDADIQEWVKLQKANVKFEVYEDWLKKATERIEENVKDLEEISNRYAYISVYIEVVNSLKARLVEAKQYLGNFAKLYINTHVNCPTCGSKEWSTP